MNKTITDITIKVGIVIFFLCFCIIGNAQNKIPFSQLSTKDGFSSNEATAIIQDSHGFMWIGTWNGLNKYDGYQCKQYFPIYNDSTTLSNREITTLLESHDEKIWIGTTSGLNCLNPKNDAIITYPFNQRIICLAEDKSGIIWIGTWYGGLYVLNPKSNKITHLLSEKCINDINIDLNTQNIWIATNSGLAKFNRSTRSFKWYTKEPFSEHRSISSNAITQIVKDITGSLWIGTKEKGLNRIQLSPNSDNIHVDYFSSNSSDKNYSLCSNEIEKLYLDSNNNLWIGTRNNGLNLLPNSELQKESSIVKFHTFQHHFQDDNSISGNKISDIFVDRSNVLWVATDKINSASLFQSGIHLKEISTSFGNNHSYEAISSLANDSNYIWAGTSQGLKLFRKQNNNFTVEKEINNISYNYKSTNYKASSILSLYSSNLNLWVGTEDAGLILYPKSEKSKSNKNFQFLNEKTNIPLSGNKVCCIKPSGRYPDIFWVGTMQNGITALTLHGDKIISSEIYNTHTGKSHISDNNTKAIQEDQEGLLWIGTQNGLSCFNPQNKHFTNYFHSLKDTASINSNIINCIFEDSGGNLWIGTNSGLNRKSERSTVNGEKRVFFKNYPSLDIVGNNIITNITEDETGSLWIKTFNGIARFNPQSERVIKYYNPNEYFNLEINNNTAITMTDGEILMGSNKGIIYFHPDSLYKNSIAPQPQITNILVLNKSIDIKDNTKKSILAPYIKEISLSHKDKMLTVIFSAMDYLDPQNNNYAYFLEGYDKTWNNMNKRNSVTFSNIPAGKYTLYYRASNSDGRWSSKNSILKISVSPPWYKTWWAVLFYALAIIIILYLFKEYSLIQVRAKNKLEIELVQGEKDRKLNELKALFFTDLTHEFRTPLTLIQGPAEEIKNTIKLPVSVYNQTNLILQNTDKLLQQINRLMDFRKIDDEKMTFLPESCNLSNLIRNISESFSYLAKTKNIEFTTDIQEQDIIASLDCEKVEKIIFNLTSNAFKYTNTNGMVRLSVYITNHTKNNQTIEIKVEDNGIGIPEKEQEKVFERFYQTHQKQTNNTGGIGLYLAKRLTELHGGKIELKSELNKGSCFSVVLPYIAAEKKDIKVSGSPTSEIQDVIPNSENKDIIETMNSANLTPEYTVLMIEDDPELNKYIYNGLSKNHNVISCYNGKEGYEKATSIIPDLIISDVMMPEMDGFEMAKELKNNLLTSHIPIIFLTAKSVASEQIKGLQLGAVDYILKPFSMEALLLKIANTIAFRDNIHKKLKTEKLLEPDNIELSSLDDKLIKDSVDAINNNLDDPTFDVEKFSEIIGLSSNQAYRKIKALTGQTVKEFIRNQRLKTAASLLLQNKRSISEIIYMVGFSSPSYFSKCFKEYYNCTPKQYIAKGGDNEAKN